MRDLFAQGLPANPLLLAVLLGFVAVFSVIVLNVFRPSKKAGYDKDSMMPLEGDK